MTKEDIVRMAQEAGFFVSLDCKVSGFEAFAALVASAEREACAKVCDEFNFGQAPMMIQKAIRARGQA